jgi:uncharacterized protein (TIGR01777 family)
MKIMITGGTGLVGKEIGKKLAAKGHELFVLTRNKQKADLHCPYPQTAVTWDELPTWSGLGELDFIINLAGAGINDQRWNESYKKKIYESRVYGTQKLIQLANEKVSHLQAFISTSAIGVYGEADDVFADEDYNKSYDFLGQVCQDWEAPLGDLQKGRSVIFRVGVVFSEKGGALAEMVPPIQGGYGGALGSGKQYMSWIDIDDLSDLYVFAVENNISGIFNATSPSPESNKAISQTIAKRLGVGLGPSVPYFALRMAVGEVAPHLVQSQKISPGRIQNKGFHFQYKTVEESIEKRVPKLKGTEKRYIFEQWIPKTKEDIFPFFSDAHNLETITPPSLNFKITSVSEGPMGVGTEIQYKLSIDGIPVNWKTLIKDWNPPHYFSDNQEKGPYSKWYHIHRFEDLAGGTLMTDQVDFKIPLGALGYLAASWKVLKDVKKIFNYRREAIHEMFN